MTYDTARQRVVLFGGYVGTFLGDTWDWDGANWTVKTPATSPTARSGCAISFDATRQRVVLFGGVWSNGVLDETWEWDGTNWSKKSPASKPAVRYNTAMSFDATRQRVVLFGGTSDGSNTLSDTWEWDGTNWAQKNPANVPSAREFHALSYDAARQRVVLFGGYNGSVNLGDTWEWDGTNWAEKTPANAPAARRESALAYDATRQRVVLIGGYTGTFRNDTWEWDGTNWSQKSPASGPPIRIQPALAYDLTRQRIVLFGGYNGSDFLDDTWEWDGTAWTRKGGSTFDMTGRANGIWNFTSITVPTGVTVSFKKNAANTPVVWLATENVQIDGTVDVSGRNSTGTDLPENVGKGGPGGFDGGVGGTRFDVSNTYVGQPGQGPGGGLPGTTNGQRGSDATYKTTYGNAYIQPLIGGSGGGGGASYSNTSNVNRNGIAGGGGGGAILIASSKDIVLNGSIQSKGGLANNDSFPYNGGNGSGGAVRLVADRVTGSGTIDVDASGRIRIEGFFRSLAGNNHSIPASGAAPVATFAPPAQGQLIVSSVAGQNVAQPPTGSLTTPDVVFTQAGQITVTVTATGIPNGTRVRLRITTSGGVIALPATGAPAVTLSGGTATFTTTVPAGTGTIQGFADYTVN